MNNIERLFYARNLLWKHKTKITIFVFIATILSMLYIVSLPRSYKSQVIMIPEENSPTGLSGSLGSLASLAGVKLGGGGSSDAIYPEFYPKVMSSPKFLCDLLRQKVQPSSVKRPITLLSYLTQHQKQAWWGKLFGSKKKKTISGEFNPYRLTKSEEKILKGLSSSVTSFVEKRTNMVTIDVLMQDPEVAAQLATVVQNKLQAYIVNYRTGKARYDLEYATKLVQKSLNAYKKAQQRYAGFSDANQDLVLSSYKQEATRLENEMQLAFDAYSGAVKQQQIAQAKLQDRIPVFTILQPASVPLKPSAPKRMVFVILVFIMSSLLSIVFVVGKDAYIKAQQKYKNEENHSQRDSLNPLAQENEIDSYRIPTEDASELYHVERTEESDE